MQTTDVPLKNLSNFQWSIELSLINWKLRLKFKWTKDYVLAAVDADNTNKIISTIKDTKSFVPVITLPAKTNPKLWNLLGKRFERSVYLVKRKSENKNTTNGYKHVLVLNFVGVNILLTNCLRWFIQIKMIMLKELKLKDITYLKVFSEIITSSSIEKTFSTNKLILI